MRYKRRAALIHTTVILLFFAAMSVFNLIYHDRGLVSLSENRPLAQLPAADRSSLQSGAFAEGMDEYINDRFILRPVFLEMNRYVSDSFGLNGGPRLIEVRGGDLFQTTMLDGARASLSGDVTAVEDVDGAGAALRDPSKSPLDRKADQIRELMKPIVVPDYPLHDARVIAGDDQRFIRNAILILGDQAFEIIQFRKSSADYYMGAVNRLADELGEGVQVYTMIVPSHISQIDPRLYGGPLGADQKASIAYFNSRAENGVTGVDVYSAMSNPDAEGLYFRTDHHWTARGAYMAYRQFARAAHIIPVPLSRYETKEVPGFLGSLELLTRNRDLAAHPDTVDLFLPFVDHDYYVYSYGKMWEKPVIDEFYADRQNKYEIFISSDKPLAIIRDKVDRDKKIAVIKDSYGNALIPFLMPHYKEIHIIDPRTFDRNLAGYIEENDIDEVLFISYFAVVASARGYADNLYRVLDLPPGGKAVTLPPFKAEAENLPANDAGTEDDRAEESGTEGSPAEETGNSG